jgi:hypothetical protein
MALEHHLEAARDAIRKAMAQQPKSDGALFSEAALHLSAARDAVAAEQRRTGATLESRRRLEHINAVISIVLACHFPLGAIPWQELEKGRDWITAILAALPHDADA